MMLFAVTIDCPDPAGLARFYQQFLGGDLYSTNETFAALTIEGNVRLDFQRVANPRPPRWPDPGAPQRLHLDFSVDDLDAAEQRVLNAGAELAEHQPGGRRFRVFFDPAGHPFCLADAATAAIPDEQA
ncbi:VOC family protein [Actinomadura chokoriensis]|uniref:VOC family protein n=1 Tax=Actinomadura chokoriensis TaxID=454156 RepID=A0ABV4R496_9ACTN